MRRIIIVLAVSALVGTAAVPSNAVVGGSAAQVGSFSQAFREDAFARGDTGCVPDGNGKLDCLPAGVSMVALPDGRILYWNALEGTENIPYGSVPEGADATVVDTNRILTLNSANPVNSTWAEPVNSSGFVNKNPHPLTPIPDTDPNEHAASLFCADQKLLADGRVLTVGGTDYYNDPRIAPGYGALELEGVNLTRIFDPGTNAWVEGAPMNFGRWYPSMVTLPDGKLFVASGVTKLLKPLYPDAPLESGTNVRQTETYDPVANTWVVNPNGDRTLPLYPRLHLLPNGKVFYDAAGQTFNPLGQAYDEVFWNLAAIYNPDAAPGFARWSELGVPGIGSTAPGFRGSTFSTPLRLEPPYDTARFLTAGGVIGTTPGAYLAIADSRISEVKIGANGNESYTSLPTGPLNNARWFSTAVPLPDGTVMAFSGADLDEVVAPGFGSPIREAELFVPSADGRDGTWKRMATQAHRRTYHNNALLLPDGRVLVGGHAPIPTGYGSVRNLPDLPVREASNNYHDASFEIFDPPYIGRPDRPTITSDVSTITRGASLRLGVPESSSIDSVVLMRNTSQTHLVDGDARSVVLAITSRGGDSLTVAVPGGPAVLPPGPYYLFVNRKAADGMILPSVAKQVFVDPPTAPRGLGDLAIGVLVNDLERLPTGVAAGDGLAAENLGADGSLGSGSSVELNRGSTTRTATRTGSDKNKPGLLLPMLLGLAILAPLFLALTRQRGRAGAVV